MTPKQILRTAHQYGYWSGRTVEMTSFGILKFAQIIMDAERQECETCSAKRQRLSDAGLLKSPMRETSMGLVASEWAGLGEPPLRRYRLDVAADWPELVAGTDPDVVEPTQWIHKVGCRANAFGKCDLGCAAPPQREWQGLTGFEIDKLYGEAQVLALREMPVLTKEDGVTLTNLQLGRVVGILRPEVEP